VQKSDLRFRPSSAYIVAMSGLSHHHDHDDSALTPARRKVLDILRREQRPIGAYEMIDLLGAETGRRPAPISVYRVLDFLVEAGRVHRLASRNAFLACDHRHGAQEPVAFLICDQCGLVTEETSVALARDVGEMARAVGFRPRAQVIEIAGRCARCGEGEGPLPQERPSGRSPARI
jgi:Fur family zinc uptake transcriptional regulator